MDIQGPFQTIATDGTKLNLKLVDEATGYIYMKTISQKTSAIVAEELQRYKQSFELKTGAKMKEICTDQGTDFDGEVLALLQDAGMSKMKGVEYKHHLPPRAERANQTVTKFGRASLLASKLPSAFYNEAQHHAVYTLNRLLHTGNTQTPYQQMYGTKPKISHLCAFGTVVYIWIPTEKRGKLENLRVKGRIIGYGDDDSLENIYGYTVMLLVY